MISAFPTRRNLHCYSGSGPVPGCLFIVVAGGVNYFPSHDFGPVP